MSWGEREDAVWQFRKVADQIQVVRRNVRFMATKGSPKKRRSASLIPTAPVQPADLDPPALGGYVVDLNRFFMRICGNRHDLRASASLPSLTWPSPVIPTISNSKWPRPTLPAGQWNSTRSPFAGRIGNVHYSLSLRRQTGYGRASPTTASGTFAR